MVQRQKKLLVHLHRVAQNKPDYLLLLSKFCISTTKHVSRCSELIAVILPFHVKFLVATYLSLVDLLDCKLVHQRRQCCLTYEQIEVHRYLSFCRRCQLRQFFLIKSFEVLRFHCLGWNSFIILTAPHPFSTRNARNNALSSLVNGRVFIFIYNYYVGNDVT